MAVVSIPLINNRNLSLDDALIIELERLVNCYIEPILKLPIDESIKYIEDNFDRFKDDYTKISTMILENINDAQKLIFIINNYNKKIKDITTKSNIEEELKDRLLDLVNIIFEGRLFLLDIIISRLEKSQIVEKLQIVDILHKTVLNNDFEKNSILNDYYFMVIMYLLHDYSPEQHAKLTKLIDLFADSVEEFDAIIETVHIMLNKERKQALENAMKEEGKIFESVDEALQYLYKD